MTTPRQERQASSPAARATPPPRRAEPDFDSVYARFWRVVHGIALSRVGALDADDVAQEVFLAVHARLGEVRDPAALPGWLCAIARNAAIDHLRRARRRPRGNGQRLDELAAHDGGSGDRSGDGELAERVLARIRELPDAYRETLVLRLCEGLTGPEIAARTGLTHGSVRVNLCRGMAMLRPLLEKEGWR